MRHDHDRLKRASRLAAILALQLAVAPAMAADQQVRPPTEEEIQTLSARQLADMMFGAAGAEIRTVERPKPPEARGEHDLSFLTFATEPRASDYAGLCEVTIYYVELLSDSVMRQHPALSSNGVYNLQVRKHYKIVGEPGLANGADPLLQERCAQAGPAIPSRAADGPGDFFFRGNSDVHDFTDTDAYFAAKALALVKALGRSTDIPISCVGNSGTRPRLCADPMSVLAGLALERLQSVDLQLCTNELAARCIAALFPSPTGRPNEYLHITTGTDVGRPELLHHIDHVGIRSVEIILVTI